MSGIYILGMEMPKHCGECGIEWCDRWKKLIVAGMSIAKSRPSGCPLIPVPPHGRLIDADALLQHQWVSRDWNCGGVHEIVVSITDIDDAPTIIEAEETNK